MIRNSSSRDCYLESAVGTTGRHENIRILEYNEKAAVWTAQSYLSSAAVHQVLIRWKYFFGRSIPEDSRRVHSTGPSPPKKATPRIARSVGSGMIQKNFSVSYCRTKVNTIIASDPGSFTETHLRIACQASYRISKMPLQPWDRQFAPGRDFSMKTWQRKCCQNAGALGQVR